VQGGIAQTVGLVFAANARRHGLSSTGWPDASTYQYCQSVEFVGRQRVRGFGFASPIEVNDPNAWLETLPEHMTGARLRVLSRNDPNISDRESVGFANGGPVFLAQIAAPNPEAWYGEWRVENQSAPDNRIWSVSYRNIADIRPDSANLDHQKVRDKLLLALEDAIKFDDRNKMGFGQTFMEARTALTDPSPLDGYYHQDIVPVDLLSLGELQIFASACKAWVFGGMGSWNDVGFDGDIQIVYQELSDRLFSSIISGIVFGVNASAKS
jgi:hypothetical protein